MKRFVRFALFALSFGLTTAFAAEMPAIQSQIRIDTTQYTCAQVVEILREHRSVWVKGFLGTYGNVAATASEITRCDGPTHGRVNCNTWTPSLRTQDGTCRAGVRCTCFGDNGGRGRDN